MIPRKYRLSGGVETEFFRRARRVNFDFARLYFMPGGTEGRAIIARIAGKKQFGLSVARHRVKRRFDQAIAVIMRELPAGKYVFVPNQRILEQEIELLTQKLREKLLK